MLLIGAIILIVTSTLGLYIAVSGLYTAGTLAFGESLWLSPACDGLYYALLLLLVLPLAGSTYRIAALIAASQMSPPTPLSGMDDTPAAPSLSDIFYPFTSFRAYGRTLLVAGEALLWFLLILALPVLLFRVTTLPLAYLSDCAPILHGLATIARPVICGLVGLGMLLLSGRRAGLGYYLFTCSRMTARDTARFLHSLHRPLLPILCLRLSFAGWAALSVAGLGFPFLFHTGPLGLMAAAVYARSLAPEPGISKS